MLMDSSPSGHIGVNVLCSQFNPWNCAQNLSHYIAMVSLCTIIIAWDVWKYKSHEVAMSLIWPPTCCKGISDVEGTNLNLDNKNVT